MASTPGAGPTAAPPGPATPDTGFAGDQAAPVVPSPPGRRTVPALGVGVAMLVLVTAASVLGRPVPPPVTGADSWFPADGTRGRFAQEAGGDIRFSEWSRPDILSLTQSDLLVLPYWRGRTDLDWVSTDYVRLHTIQAGQDGTGTALSDTLWTLGDDGARTAIESSFPGETSILLPGRLDLPAGLRAGSTWTSEGTARTWDDAAGTFVESKYLADYAAQASSEPTQAERGCLDVTMELAVGEARRTERHLWCPGEGFAGYTDPTGTWVTTRGAPPVQPSPEEPFDWSTADRLDFTPRTANQPMAEGSISLYPVAPPGVLRGGAVFVGQTQPDVLAVRTDDGLQVAWAARPGGTPTASATLGAITVVATTYRQAVAYNNQGRWLWEAPLSDLSVVPPVRFGERAAVFVTLDGAVTALDLTSGTELWRTELGAEIRTVPTVAGDRLLVANQAGALACIDGAGEQVWVEDAGVPRSIAVSPGPDPVVVYGEDGSLVLRAYSLADGRQVWRSRIYQDARDLIGLDTTVVVRDDDAVLGVDWRTGAVGWQWNATRTEDGIGGGRRALLLSDTGLILLDDGGRQVRTWQHHLGTVTSSTPYLVAAAGMVLAYGPAGIDIGAVP